MKSTFVRRLAASALILILTTSGFAADGSLSPRDVDSRIDQAIVRTINIGGTDLQPG